MVNKKSLFYVLVLILCFTIVYFGCCPLKVVNGRLVMSLSQYIAVDASVSDEHKKLVSPIIVEYKNLNYSEIEKLYINNKEIISQESIKRQESNNRTIHYKFQDGSSVVTGGTDFEYHTELSNNLTKLIDVDYPELLDLHGENHEQLEFSPKNVVIVKVLEQLSNIGIQDSKLSNIYSFNDQELNKIKQGLLDSPLKQERKHDVDREWIKEDECYLLVFNQFLNDIAIDANSYDKIKVDHSMKNQIVVLYNKDGIQMIKTTAIYSKKQKQPQENIMSLKDALRIYKRKYQKESKEQEKYIKGIDLVYVRKETLKNEGLLLTPAWRFTVYEEDAQGSISCVYFDAVSKIEL